MKSIYSYTLEELTNYLLSIGEKPFRATQIYEWLYRGLVSSFDEMTNISSKLISKLKEEFTIDQLKVVTKEVSKDGTCKYLYELSDGKLIETVLMRHNYGNSVCVTSQVGCNMKCAFCASGELGKIRNLELHEMVLQVLHIQLELKEIFERVSNVVVMGIGEPFDNYDTVMKFLNVLNYPKGFEIGARHMTVSTCGIVPKIKEFANFPLQVNLALSLHAPNDKLRDELMPINKRYKLSEVIEALKYYFDKTNRRITFEYILLKDINDTDKCAEELVKLIKGINAYVNLIPYNEVKTKPFKRTTKEQAEKFFSILHSNGINVTLRMEHGTDISAACGQLRAKKIKGEI